MRIAQIAPLYESVPPQLYGGTERVVAYLTDALVEAGHEVTLFASGDSHTRAELVSSVPHSLRLDAHCLDNLAPHFVQLEDVFSRLDAFDLVHWHTDYLHFPLSARHRYPRVTTLHGRLDIPELAPLYGRFRQEPLVSISDNQRQPLAWANWVGTVYHGLPPERHVLQPDAEDYLIAVGRMSPEKRMDRAIEIARRAGRQLVIAAKVDKADQEYFEGVIKPLLDSPHVEFIGEVSERERDRLVGRAKAFLFPIDWPEPFGMVMIESMAVGTPVIAWRHGSVPEVVDDGVTGFVVSSIGEAVEAVHQAAQLDRRAVRAQLDRRFSAQRMAADYVKLYERLRGLHHEQPGAEAA